MSSLALLDGDADIIVSLGFTPRYCHAPACESTSSMQTLCYPDMTCISMHQRHTKAYVLCFVPPGEVRAFLTRVAAADRSDFSFCWGGCWRGVARSSAGARRHPKPVAREAAAKGRLSRPCSSRARRAAP